MIDTVAILVSSLLVLFIAIRATILDVKLRSERPDTDGLSRSPDED